MIHKTIKIFAIAIALMIGNLVYAANRYYQVINTVQSKVTVELATMSGYSKTFTLDLGRISPVWVVPEEKGCLFSIRVNGKDLRIGQVCDPLETNMRVDIYPGWEANTPIMVSVSPVK